MWCVIGAKIVLWSKITSKWLPKPRTFQDSLSIVNVLFIGFCYNERCHRDNLLLSFSRIKGTYCKLEMLVWSGSWPDSTWIVKTHIWPLPKELFTSAWVTGVLLLEAVLTGIHIYIDRNFAALFIRIAWPSKRYIYVCEWLEGTLWEISWLYSDISLIRPDVKKSRLRPFHLAL